MFCELFAVVECNGVASVLVWSQQVGCHSCYASGMLTPYMPGQYIAILSLRECDQSTTMILDDDGVAFPVAETHLLINYFRAIINTDAVFYHTTSLLTTCITLAAFFLAMQVTTKIAAVTSISLDMLIDCFMADLKATFQLKTVGGLLWTQVFSYQTIDPAHSLNENCLPLLQACFRQSRNDCAWFGRQPRLPLLRLNSLEMVDLTTPTYRAIWV